MNRHAFVDLFALHMAALETGRDRFFQRTVESAPMREHLSHVHLQPPPELTHGRHELSADTLVGRVDPAFFVYHWRGPTFPTIIYHHGNQERPFDFGSRSKNTFRSILAADARRIEANLIVVRAPFHRWPTRDYMRRMGDLTNFMAMLATSVRLIDALLRVCREEGSPRIMVAGISLGGLVTNLHRAYCDTADLYVPLLAGAEHGDVFTSSAYRRLLGKQGRRHPELVRELLNFEADYQKVKTDNVFPLLARYDQYIVFERQRECYENRPVRVMERGHITAALSSALLRQHIIDVLKGDVPAP